MPCVPGRKSSAGIAVWLMMKNSAIPHCDGGVDGGLSAGRFIHRHHFAREPFGVETPARRRPGAEAKLAPGFRIARQPNHARRQAGGVSGAWVMASPLRR